MAPKWIKQRTNNLILLQNHDIFTTLVGFAHNAAILELDSRRRDPRPRRDFVVKRPRLWKTFLEMCLGLNTCLETSTFDIYTISLSSRHKA